MCWKRIVQVWAVIFGISALACGGGPEGYTAPEHFEGGSSGELCGDENDGDFHGYCSEPDETCIHKPYDERDIPSASYCGYDPGRCVEDVRDRYAHDPPTDYGPVCGCDGKTYRSPYKALDAGVSIDEYGRCKQASRAECGPTAGECPSDETCIYAPETNCGQDGTGTCLRKPKQCPYVYEPVCGCNGQTYRNECMAQDTGISVQHTGECGSQPMNLELPTAPDLTSWEEHARLLPDVPYPSSDGADEESPSEELPSEEPTSESIR